MSYQWRVSLYVVIYVAPLYVWSWLTHYQPCLSSVVINYNICVPWIFIFGICYPTLTLYPLKMTWNPWKQTLHVPNWMLNQENSKSAPNKAGDHTWSKEMQPKWKPEPVPANEIRLLLFDKCKFTKPLIKVVNMSNSSNWSYIYLI